MKNNTYISVEEAHFLRLLIERRIMKSKKRPLIASYGFEKEEKLIDKMLKIIDTED